MRKLLFIAIASFFLFLTTSCSKEKTVPACLPPETESLYSFFVAGHVYGNPNSPQLGIFPPFKKHINYINNYKNIEFGVFTGDVVVTPDTAHWEAFVLDQEQFNIPTHIAAGNHDRGRIFLDIYERYYYYFIQNNDLFIILNPTAWSITGEQKEFLEEVISTNHESVDNIFIFCHELIWWAPDNKFGNIQINYRPQYPGDLNFWNEIHPFLTSIPRNIVLFAGDVGASHKTSPYMYYEEGNITLIASGMGNATKSNFIITEVDSLKNIRFKLLGITGDVPYTFAVLEDFILP